MRIIFLEDVPGSGRAGEVKEVKNGYARNYLLPRKLASLATHDQLQRIETIRKVAEERHLKEEKELGALAEQLGQLAVSLTAKMGPTGRFYGTVTSAQIAEELSWLADREIQRRVVYLEEPIHEPGEYQAEIRFAHGITATIPVTVTAEGVEPAEAAKEAEQVEAVEKAELPEAVEQLEQEEATGQTEQAEETVDQLEQAEETEEAEETEKAQEEEEK